MRENGGLVQVSHHGDSETQDKTLFRIGGICFLAGGIIQTAGYIWGPTGIDDIFGPEPNEALQLITLHTRALQFVLGGQVLSYVILIPFWLAVYEALKRGKRTFAMLGAAAGILDSIKVVVMVISAAAVLPVLAQLYSSADETNRTAARAVYFAVGGAGGGGLSTALRVPSIGFTSLAFLPGQKFSRWLAWLGIATAALTIVELGMWVVLGSPNAGVPVGGVAAVLGIVWGILAAAWLIRFRPSAL